MKLGTRIQSLRQRVDARTQRERLLLAAAVAVIVVLVWEMAVRAPLSQTTQEIRDETEGINQQTADLRTSLDDLEAKLAEARREGDQGRIERLRQRLTELDNTLQKRTRRLISPKQMVDVVRAMVASDDALRLISLANQPVEAVIKQDAAGESGKAIPRVYRHGVELVIEGDYFAVLDYLRRLENLDWAFDWRAVDIERRDYPTARATVSLATLSLEEDWIGV